MYRTESDETESGMSSRLSTNPTAVNIATPALFQVVLDGQLVYSLAHRIPCEVGRLTQRSLSPKNFDETLNALVSLVPPDLCVDPLRKAFEHFRLDLSDI